MRRWLIKKLWPYIERQMGDVARILFRKWGSEPPMSLQDMANDLGAATEWVLKHGRPPEDFVIR